MLFDFDGIHGFSDRVVVCAPWWVRGDYTDKLPVMQDYFAFFLVFLIFLDFFLVFPGFRVKEMGILLHDGGYHVKKTGIFLHDTANLAAN
jgi:hypothetical protein